MYNYIVMRIAYLPTFLILFVSGLCTGSVMGLLFVLMDHSIGIFGGAFLALLSGLLSGLFGLIYTAVFNTLAPSLGGLSLTIESFPVVPMDNGIIEPPDLPFY